MKININTAKLLCFSMIFERIKPNTNSIYIYTVITPGTILNTQIQAWKVQDTKMSISKIVMSKSWSG